MGQEKDLEKLTELMRAHEKGDELSISFRKVYLEELLRRTKSPQKALTKLVTCLKYFKKLEEMDAKMDKAYFAELIQSDFGMVSGHDK